MRPKESIQYTLPPGCISEPLTASDGSIWVNHSSGFFRLFNGNVTPVIRYNESGVQPGYVSNLNPYKHTTYLPSPVLVHDQIYISCRECGAACVMCFSLDASLIWKRNVGHSCSILLSNSIGVFALHDNSVEEITDGIELNAGIPMPAGEIIGYLTVKNDFFFAILINRKIRLLQISSELKIESNLLLDTRMYGFETRTCYPVLTSNAQNIFLFFRVIDPPFTGLEEYRFLFTPDTKIEFQCKNSYGVTSRSKTTYSLSSAVFAHKDGFSFTNLLYAGADVYNRLWQVETNTGTVDIKKLPGEIQAFASHQRVLSIGENYYVPYEDIYGKSFIGRFRDGHFSYKKCPEFKSWFTSNNRIWVSMEKGESCILRQLPDWPKE